VTDRWTDKRSAYNADSLVTAGLYVALEFTYLISVHKSYYY